VTGHIRRRGKNSWELKFDIGREERTGKRQIRYHSFKGTKREAEIELARLITSAAKGDYIDPSKETVAEFLDRWDRDWIEHNVSPKTGERYRQLIKNQIKPHIGGLRLQKLRPVHLAELYAKLLREGRTRGGSEKPTASVGLNARTVGHVHRLVHRALGIAVQWGVVHRNISDATDPPPVTSTEIKILSEGQIGQVLAHIRGRTLSPIVSVDLATGLRRGELVGLRWKDIDFEAGKLRVEQSVEQTKKAGLRIKPPKTKHGRRTLALPASIVAELRAHRTAQQRRRLALGLGKVPDDSMVFARWDGSIRSPHWLTQKFGLVAEELGLKGITFHCIRHTHASALIASGMDILTISRRLGHGSPAVTLAVYGHLFTNTDDRAAQVLEGVLSRARTEQEHL
jgi:integrase